MLSVINILVLFFIILLIYQIFLAIFQNSILEGLTNSSTSQQYQPYDTNNPNNALILAQQNAGNIQVLEQQMNGLLSLNQEVQDISGNVANLQTQVNGIVAAQQQYSQNMTSSPPPVITGATTPSS
jgi:hypothetical protein